MTDEVLVHISTPATRQNDELFRSLANAYVAFQPSRIYRDESARKKTRLAQTTGRESPDVVPAKEGEASPSVLTASKESYGSFPSNISSEGQHYQDPAAAGDSMYPTSRLAQLDRSYLSWRKRAAPRTSLSGGLTGLSKSSSEAEDIDTGFIEDSQLAREILQSQLQDAYSMTSEDTSEDDEDPDGLDGSTVEWSSQKSGFAQHQYSEVVEDVQLPSALEMDVLADLEENALDIPTDLSIHADPSVHTDQALKDKSFMQEDQLCFAALPLDAFPPAPPISVTRPGTLPSQITKHLAMIKLNNPDRFKPLKMQRALDADERGHWLVECTPWPPRLQWDFWTILCGHVCSGRIGWGTTLFRETEVDQTLGRIKLYCWGEVVEHMWLLMWLCSKGQMLDLDSCWVDANGIAAVEVKRIGPDKDPASGRDRLENA